MQDAERMHISIFNFLGRTKHLCFEIKMVKCRCRQAVNMPSIEN